MCMTSNIVSRYSYGLDDPAASRPALGLTQSPNQWIPGALSLGVKRHGREGDHLPPSSAQVKNSGTIFALSDMSSWHDA
jgi:hypothetical protein